MNDSRIVLWATIALLSVGFLVACGQSRIEIGMVETHLPGQWEANYRTFTGTKTDRFRAEAGQTLLVEYSAQVEKGRLDFRVQRPGGELLWEVSLQEGGQETLELDIETGGRYAIVIEGNNTGGSFVLSWSLEE